MQLTAQTLTEYKPGEPITKICLRCNQQFTYRPKNELEAKFINQCDPCWEITDAEREATYTQVIVGAQVQAMKAPFPVEMMEKWDPARWVGEKTRLSVISWRPTDKQRNLFIFGANGTCKTRLACQLAHDLQRDHGHAKFRPFQAFAAEVNSYGQRYFKEMLDDVVKAKLLVLDDLTFNSGIREADARLAFLVIDGRYRARRTTIITSNNAPDEFTQANPENWFLKSIQSRIGFSYGKRGVSK